MAPQNYSDTDKAEDVKVLHNMGYAQELERRLSRFSNFAVSFSIICILSGGINSLAQGTAGAGGIGIGIGWLVGCFVSLTFAVAMSQISSAYPTAGGLYHWGSILGNRGTGWVTAWLNLLGLITVLGAINVGTWTFFIGAFGPALHIDGSLTNQMIFLVVITGAQAKAPANAPAYTKVFAESLIQEAREDDRIVAVTAAMPSGTGLDLFGEAFPSRTFDVGIAEQHAVTFAAGLATEGYKPFAAIYSTFLQRAYDQVVHDVAIQHLPVRFPIDRAGFVGADGATHCGAFDTTFLASLPNFVVMAAADEAELRHMVRTAAEYDEGPISFRYPRGNGVGVDMPERGSALEIGKGSIVREGTKMALLSFGTRLQDCLAAAEELGAAGLSTTVADARFAKPLDEDLVRRLARSHEVLVTVEEGAIGGFASQVLQFLAHDGLLECGLKVRPLVLPDAFVDHAKPEKMYADAGLDAAGIVRTVFVALGHAIRAQRA